jgi:hypothetical protein
MSRYVSSSSDARHNRRQPSRRTTGQDPQDNQEAFESLVKSYLDNIFYTKDGEPELEVRFGTRGNSLGKHDFDNVIQKLLSHQFTFEKKNAYTLKIQNEFIDPKTGKERLSLIRTEINGISEIQKYCKTNMITQERVLFTQKSYEHRRVRDDSDSTGDEESNGGWTQVTRGNNGGGGQKERIVDEAIPPVNFDDFNFRVTYQKEKRVSNTSTLARSIITTWNDSKKTFRYINRSSLVHPDFPFRIDVSVVKESHKDKDNHRYVPEYTIEASKVIDNTPKYEIEIEVLNNKVGPGTPFNNAKYLCATLRKCIKMVLSGIQQSNFPISTSEINRVKRQYFQLIYPDEYDRIRGKRGGRPDEDEQDDDYERRDDDDEKSESDEENNERRDEDSNVRIHLYPKHFIGPSSYTLQIHNIMQPNSDTDTPSIRTNYTVTDKADGDRKLLFIAPRTGRIYLIDTTMNIQFTGAITLNPKLYNSLIDGEHIIHDKRGEYINLYAAFDIYFLHKTDVRTRMFMTQNPEDIESNYRLLLLISAIKNLELKSVINADVLPPIRIENKKFLATNESKSIFDCCSIILERVKNDLYEYNTDGLIFTPSDRGVGSNIPGDGHAGPLHKVTWDYSFKWKPAMFNTNDFLITTKKNQNQDDFIGNIFESGMNLATTNQMTQYKTLILRVGYDEKKHGYINPCVSIIEDQIPGKNNSQYSIDNDDTYKPAPFYPSCPYDETAHICNILITYDADGNGTIMTENKEIISDESIVEFRYDKSKPEYWRWVPIRVRHDKTAEYRAGIKNYGNAYHVANSNWYSMHNPITIEMLTTGDDIPNELATDDIYYNRGNNSAKNTGTTTLTQPTRDFHNLYVKRTLIHSVANIGNTLIDLAVGKGGDLPKWIAAKLSFVFGIDYSKDNIENKIDGVCARYLNYRKRFNRMPSGIFIHGDSSQLIRNGTAAITDRYKQITRAIFGEGAKDADILGRGVYNQYGKGENGFDICSVQFAIHYFFANTKSMHTFLCNVCECTKMGGYFIGTCYDGEAIFDYLRDVEVDETRAVFVKGPRDDTEPRKIWSIKKKYTQTTFDDDSSSIGYPIEVFNESIGKTFVEYLVNFNYLIQMLENYGFVLITQEEATQLEHLLPDGTGTFAQLYNNMANELKRNPERSREYGDALQMTAEEKMISFFNRYFVFKKVRNIDGRKLMSSFLAYASIQEEHESTKEDIEKAEQRIVAAATRELKDTGDKRVPDISSGPAIAADLLQKKEEKVAEETEKKNTARNIVFKIKSSDTPAVASSASAPIEMIEKQIRKTPFPSSDAGDVSEPVKKARAPRRTKKEMEEAANAMVGDAKVKKTRKAKKNGTDE